MRFRFVILAAGSIAGRFADAVTGIKDCMIATVASKALSRAEAFARNTGMDEVFDDYEKMLKTERPDCACILSEGKNLYESNSGSVLIIPRHSVKSRIMLIWPKRIPPGRFRQTSRGELEFYHHLSDHRCSLREAMVYAP